MFWLSQLLEVVWGSIKERPGQWPQFGRWRLALLSGFDHGLSSCQNVVFGIRVLADLITESGGFEQDSLMSVRVSWPQPHRRIAEVEPHSGHSQRPQP